MNDSEKFKLLFDIELDKNDGEALYIQLACKIMQLIESGKIPPDFKLPSIRLLSQRLGVNNITVINCYKYLENRKIVYSQKGSGTYAASIGINSVSELDVRQQRSINMLEKTKSASAINFAESSVSSDLFPVKKFKVFFNEVLDRDKGNAFSLQDIQGYPPLREVIAENLEKYKIKTSPDKIQIISGAQQGIDIIAKAMLSFGDEVFVERPTYYGAVDAILSRGAKIIDIPMLSDGIDIEALEHMLNLYHPRFIYVMPNYQTPTCISYSQEKKRKILNLAYKNNIYIVEEDNLSDFNYSGTAVSTLKSFDYKNKVIYIKSFSKILMPGLRLGFMVLPKPILENVVSAKYSTDISTSSFIQRAFKLFIDNGDWDKHILYMRNIFGKKYSLTSSEIKKNLSKYTSYIEPYGGLSFYLKLKNKNLTSEELCLRLAEKNVILAPSSIYYLSDEFAQQCIRLSFSNVSDESIVKGIKIISEELKLAQTAKASAPIK